MYIMMTDETNRRPSTKVKFFVYGGLIFPLEHLQLLDDAIGKIREGAGYRQGDVFKFDTRSRPKHVPIENARDAKRELIKLCRDIRCTFIVHVILHDIIANQDPGQQVQWAADYVISRFNRYLEDAKDDGICIIDNLPERGQFKYLTDKFQSGLHRTPGEDIQLERIKLYAATCIGASHASSAMDIVLGSFRYCINDPPNIDAAIEMLQNLVPMIWYKDVGGVKTYLDNGLIIRPRLAKVYVDFPTFRHHYDALVDQINRLAKGEN